MNNSALTGEPEPLERTQHCTDPDVMETKNIAFFGTFCEQGTCAGLVLRTGDSTRMGQIASETSKDDEELRRDFVNRCLKNEELRRNLINRIYCPKI